MTTCKNCGEEIFYIKEVWSQQKQWHHLRTKQWPEKNYRSYSMACSNPYHAPMAEPE